MASSSPRRVVISTGEVSERENYSKVILHKQMLFPVNKTEAEMDIDGRNDEPRGLVKRRILEMNSHHENERRNSSPKRNYHGSRKTSSPNLVHSRFENSSRQKSLLAPKPYRSKSSTNEASKLQWSSINKATSSSSLSANKTSYSRSIDRCAMERVQKPEVPPKPSHVQVTPPSKLTGQTNHMRVGAPSTSQKCDPHDSGVSEEADDVFSDSPINCSFTSLSQKMDEQKYDLLKRRQSYSEFEDLIEKKREIRERMMTKITLLREERDILLEEKAENDVLGKKTAEKLERVATSAEIDKYGQFLEEIEQITKLTVSLTIRLTRLTKKIDSGTFTNEDYDTQTKKKSKLIEQLNEAEMLHRNTDRRRIQVRNVLAKYLDDKDLSDYDNFLDNLIKHITDLKETEQRIQLGEEQLVALNDNIIALPLKE